MISDKYKCVFIHIPKTAGTSIEKKLEHFDHLAPGVQDHSTIKEVEPQSLFEVVSSISSLDWPTISRSIKKKIRDRRSGFDRTYTAYFKFSFVRNPWARAFSWYKNVMRDDHHKKRFGIVDELSFNAFIHQFGGKYELKPQMHWLRDKTGSIPMDYIGKFENLNRDFEIIAEKIGLVDGELPKLIVGSGQDYTRSYDNASIDVVNKLYQEEIELFHYKFSD